MIFNWFFSRYSVIINFIIETKTFEKKKLILYISVLRCSFHFLIFYSFLSYSFLINIMNDSIEKKALWNIFSFIKLMLIQNLSSLYYFVSNGRFLKRMQRNSNPQPLSSYVKEHSTIWPNWSNDWAVLWEPICTVHLTVCSYHVTYACQGIACSK